MYGRTIAQTGGLLQLWLAKRFASVLALQPFLMGLELLTRRLWPEAGALLGSALVTVLLVEVFAFFLTRRRSARSLHPITREALASFVRAARPRKNTTYSDGSVSAESSHRNGGPRGSYASVLDMMNQTLAMPTSTYQTRSPVPLREFLFIFSVFCSVRSIQVSKDPMIRPDTDVSACAIVPRTPDSDPARIPIPHSYPITCCRDVLLYFVADDDHRCTTETEAIDDLIQTDLAARTHPDAAPRLPALPWTAAAGEGQLLYAPVLLAPPPPIWLPDDTAGVARGEAFDLERYHGLRAVLDVRSVQDKSARRRSAAQG